MTLTYILYRRFEVGSNLTSVAYQQQLRLVDTLVWCVELSFF